MHSLKSKYTIYQPTTLGVLELCFAGEYLTGLKILDDTNDNPNAVATPLHQQYAVQLADFLAGERVAFDIPIDFQKGTAFEREVWNALVEIPYGATITYGELARRIGKDAKFSRAVGRAVGQNPIAIVVPCHRVIGKNGALTGYAWGVDRKSFLLDLEQKHRYPHRKTQHGTQGTLF